MRWIVPRIGYVHSWQRTQDEGWVRAALDYYGVPYTYFADQQLRDGNLRAKYDVIIFPHVGGIVGVVPHRHSESRARSGSLQENRTDAQPGRARFRATIFAAAWASKVWPSSPSSWRKAAR